MTGNTSARQAQPDMVALFVSDLHLQESTPATTVAFLNFLQQHARHARQLYLLGDLFEYWAGDDDLDAPLNRRIVNALRAVSDAGTELFWIGGNRDFLIGDGFLNAIRAKRLADGSVVHIAGHTIVLAHGDAQCTDDVAYMAFRQQVRQADWQLGFLATPLAQRKAIIEKMREQSRAAQREKSVEIMDVNRTAIDDLFASSATTCMIHGHTHRPAAHCSNHGGKTTMRYVLPDWDSSAKPPRGGWIGIDTGGAIQCFNSDGAAA